MNGQETTIVDIFFDWIRMVSDGRGPVRLWPRHLAHEALRLCLVETVLPSPEDVLLL